MTNLQEEFLNNQPAWPFYNVINSNLDHQSYVDYHSAADFSLPPPSDDMDDITTANASFHEFSSMLTDDGELGMEMITLSTDELFMGLDRFDRPNFSDSECRNDTVYEDGSSLSRSPSNDNVSAMELANQDPDPNPNPNPRLEIPREGIELGNEISVFHLLKEYGEAMEGGHMELAEVIMASVSEKVTPAGDPLERLAFNLSQDLRKEVDYIKQEALKNYEAAFRAFYQIFPYGRFAHFAANSAMVKSIPATAESIHIVDFDIGEGVQWPPVIEALAQMSSVKCVTLTAVNNWGETRSEMESEEELGLEDCDWAPAMWDFEEVKRRLLDLSSRIGLKLEIQEIRIEDLGNEIRKRKSRGLEWCVFNCMTGLPHMRRVRSRKVVDEFLGLARESISESTGLLTRGEGEAWESLADCSGFGSFFEGNMEYYRSLLESIEVSFPELAEARMALECLFVAPFISSEGWFRRWSEMGEIQGKEEGTAERGWRVSRESLEEAKEMVKERQSSFGVRIGGEEENEMVLEWKGTPLVRVSSAWRN
ncbi:Protein NODULATION SIGNALING PATHWAY 2 [Linum perenne]